MLIEACAAVRRWALLVAALAMFVPGILPAADKNVGMIVADDLGRSCISLFLISQTLLFSSHESIDWSSM
jgi:hypothetical protein